MKTLRLLRGDLVLTGGEYQEVTGGEKIRQDLRGALLEPLGNDRFHPGWGSVLHTFIGKNYVTEESKSRIAQEIIRVIGNYVAVQRDNLQRDSLSGRKARYTTSDIVRGVNGVNMTDKNDKVYGVIKLSTYGAYNISLTLPVGKSA